MSDEAIYEPGPAVETMTPEGFDLEAWLSGLLPARAHYPLAGVTVVLQAKTMSWVEEFRKKHEGLDPQELDLRLLAEYIVEPELGVDELRVIRQTHGPEVAEMLSLAVDMTVKPRSQIQPRFLPKPSG